MPTVSIPNFLGRDLLKNINFRPSYWHMKKINGSLKIFWALFLSSHYGLLIAQEPYPISKLDSLPSQTLDEVVVTANRYGSLWLSTSEAIGVMSGTSIQRSQLRTTPEALVLTPGVFVQKTNHGGGSPFLRGLTGNQTLLLVDGIRLNNSIVRSGPNQYFNTIDVFSIGKIEALRGSGSVQYGSDALGGAIQVFSHDLTIAEKPSWNGSLLTRVATQGMEQSLNAIASYSTKKAAFRGGFTWRDFGDLVGGDTTGLQVPTGYQENDFDLKGKIILSPTSSLTMVYQKVHQNNVPVFHKIALENYAINKMATQKRKLAYLRLHQKFKAGLIKSIVLTASYQHSEERRELLKNQSSDFKNEDDKVRTLAFSAETFMANNTGWSANSGIEVYNDLVNSNRNTTDLSTKVTHTERGLYPDGATMTSIAAFSMHNYDMNNWSITAGARFNTFITKVFDANVGTIKLTPSALVSNLGVLRKLSGRSNLFVSMNTGFRTPNINDLGSIGIVDFRYETPNFNLKPEHSLQVQLGYKFVDNKVKGEVYLYRNQLYDLITRNKIVGDSIEGYQVYQKKNTQRAHIQGIETAWDFKLNPTWTLSSSMTYTYGQNRTNDLPIRRIPPLFGRLAMGYTTKKLGLTLEWQATGKQNRLSPGDIDDNRIPEGGTPSWNVLNMTASYAMRHVAIDISLLNLFNQDYRFHGSGVNGYGRSAFLSLRVFL